MPLDGTLPTPGSEKKLTQPQKKTNTNNVDNSTTGTKSPEKGHHQHLSLNKHQNKQPQNTHTTHITRTHNIPTAYTKHTHISAMFFPLLPNSLLLSYGFRKRCM